MPQPRTKNILTIGDGAAPNLPPRTVELLAAATARLIEANVPVLGPSIEHAGTFAAGLDVSDQPALSVPTGERDRPEPENAPRCHPSLSFWVYVLRSQSSGKRYVGHTDDLERRLIEHNSIGHNVRKFTSRNAGPWVLVVVEECATRAQAVAREKWLKSGAGRAWLDSTIGRANPPKAD